MYFEAISQVFKRKKGHYDRIYYVICSIPPEYIRLKEQSWPAEKQERRNFLFWFTAFWTFWAAHPYSWFCGHLKAYCQWPSQSGKFLERYLKTKVKSLYFSWDAWKCRKHPWLESFSSVFIIRGQSQLNFINWHVDEINGDKKEAGVLFFRMQ